MVDVILWTSMTSMVLSKRFSYWWVLCNGRNMDSICQFLLLLEMHFRQSAFTSDVMLVVLLDVMLV